MKNYFICKVRYDRLLENGAQKIVTEQYLVDALSFTEAELRINKEMEQYVTGAFSILDISRYKVAESFIGDKYEGDKYYKAKVEYITLDEKSGSEKKQGVYMLVQATDLEQARDIIVQKMKVGMIDYNLAKIEETKILEVFEVFT